MKKRVLIIDDSAYMRMLIRDGLADAGYEVVAEAATGEDGMEMALKFQPDLITLDNVLPDMFGRDLLKIFKEKNLKSEVIMISAVGQNTVISEELSLGAIDYLVKPFTQETFAAALKKVASRNKVA